MPNMEIYKAYLKAVRVSECLLTAYAKEDHGSAAYSRRGAVDELKKLAHQLGFELVPVVATEEKAAA